jgi:hypothetical protein
MRADILPVFTLFVIVQGYILSLIRLFQFTLAWGELENPPSPRGRLSCAKQQFTWGITGDFRWPYTFFKEETI